MVINLFKTSGLELRVTQASDDWNLCDLSGRVIASSLPSPPSKVELRSSSGSHSSGSIPPLPLPIQLTLWLGWKRGWLVKFTHETIAAELPPKVKIKIEIFPPEGYADFIWAMTFGELVEPKVVLIHEHPLMMWEHEDPLIYSIVSQVYPLNIYATIEHPHIATMENRTDLAQWVEATFWMVRATRAAAEHIFKLMEAMEKAYLNLAMLPVLEIPVKLPPGIIEMLKPR